MYYDALENDKGEKAEHFRMKGIPSDTIKREAFHITVTENWKNKNSQVWLHRLFLWVFHKILDFSDFLIFFSP